MTHYLITLMTTHFFFLKMKLNARHATEKVMPAIARIEKVTVRGTATVTSCSTGTPSCGIIPPRIQVCEGDKNHQRTF